MTGHSCTLKVSTSVLTTGVGRPQPTLDLFSSVLWLLLFHRSFFSFFFTQCLSLPPFSSFRVTLTPLLLGVFEKSARRAERDLIFTLTPGKTLHEPWWMVLTSLCHRWQWKACVSVCVRTHTSNLLQRHDKAIDPGPELDSISASRTVCAGATVYIHLYVTHTFTFLSLFFTTLPVLHLSDSREMRGKLQSVMSYRVQFIGLDRALRRYLWSAYTQTTKPTLNIYFASLLSCVALVS